MAEFFKIEKDKNSTGYILLPTSEALKNYNVSSFPFCYSSIIFEAFNFSIKDSLKTFISRYEANVLITHNYPYFKITFPKKNLAETFCLEVNKRLKEKEIF